jgi:hypothetical protein
MAEMFTFRDSNHIIAQEEFCVLSGLSVTLA